MIPMYIYNQTQQCITQNGVKYCENTNITKQEVGYILLLILGALIWIVICIKITEKYTEKYGNEGVLIGIGLGFILLMFIGAIICLLK